MTALTDEEVAQIAREAAAQEIRTWGMGDRANATALGLRDEKTDTAFAILGARAVAAKLSGGAGEPVAASALVERHSQTIRELAAMPRDLFDVLCFTEPGLMTQLRDLLATTAPHPLLANAYGEGAMSMVEDLTQQCADLRRDALILLASIDWVREVTGEGPEDEDAAMVEQIRASLTGLATPPAEPAVVLGYDLSSGPDVSAEVTGRVNEDGSLTIDDIKYTKPAPVADGLVERLRADKIWIKEPRPANDLELLAAARITADAAVIAGKDAELREVRVKLIGTVENCGAEMCRAEKAEAERDALRQAAGFKPGPFTDDLSRKVILEDIEGMRPAMVEARRAQSRSEGDAMLWQMSCLDGKHEPLLLRVWEQRKAAEARITDLQAALTDARKTMRNARGACESNQVVDKDVEGQLTRGMERIDAALNAGERDAK